jgi:hypothetical protein
MVDENPRRGFDWPRESEANTARSRITASGRNPKGGEGTECDWAVPSLSPLEREVNALVLRENVRELKVTERSHPSLSLRVGALELWERERTSEMKWALQALKKRQNTHKLVIFSTSVVKKWNFVIKMYSFQKIMLYLFMWTYQRGALICLRNFKRPSMNLTK